MLISKFNLIPTPLPPMLPGMVGVPENSRYFSLCYYGSKATWSDGRSFGTFSFYAVYQPLINHMTLDIYLWRYHLGSDDKYPDHAILCDRPSAKIYVGEYEEVSQLLKSQHPPQPPITKEHWEQIKSQTEANVNTKTVEDFQHMGMFEMFGNISPRRETYAKLGNRFMEDIC